ncbi:endoribonuclease L-PSP [Trinickia caryophylli]|uniref:Enamine deaminase RidA, house cleaning of reactive enamine intermediates, YjgF/YER057c/UK114 family n=1 Tax=Trinickia caryophylli TaxID=28094 RepID=A0A1X7CEX4_TRICW|nr:endoribonuclease L-PSP [Trinickia caryophylli]WQE12876.1 endoribonuclease L-PSP [Trinickia caryophylli]SME95269.1 Enamine deaminase RidA, house cleaning of reactive enamine intermediates, YjgF/YER057c/UK114 family [Trinickia caryophylli]
MSAASLKLIRLEHARLAALMRGECANARSDALTHALRGALGAACFGDATCWPLLAEAAPDLPLAPGHMARLVPAPGRTGELSDVSDACFEVWHCDAADLASGRLGPVHYRFSESAGIVFGSVSLFEEPAGSSVQGATPLERATYLAYEAIFRMLDALGIRHLLRIWNVVPAINAEQFGSERYRQFNTGRQRAFMACGRPVVDSVPAASALGAPVSIEGDAPPSMPLAVSFLATRSPSDAIENPRQVSAYRYPREYGPSAPTFARAAAWRGACRPGTAPALFVSGTASIVGHETVHRGDAMAQLRETLANIDAVLAQAAQGNLGNATLADLAYKIYVRDPDDADTLAAIDEVLCARCGFPPRVLYLHADICRADLLLEIEASTGHGVEVLA